MEVLGPIDEVVRIEQHLCADQTVTGELVVVGLDETALSSRRDGLEGLDVGGTRRQAERRNARRDRS